MGTLSHRLEGKKNVVEPTAGPARSCSLFPLAACLFFVFVFFFVQLELVTELWPVLLDRSTQQGEAQFQRYGYAAMSLLRQVMMILRAPRRNNPPFFVFFIFFIQTLCKSTYLPTVAGLKPHGHMLNFAAGGWGRVSGGDLIARLTLEWSARFLRCGAAIVCTYLSVEDAAHAAVPPSPLHGYVIFLLCCVSLQCSERITRETSPP